MTRSSFRLMLVVLPRILIVAPDGPFCNKIAHGPSPKSEQVPKSEHFGIPQAGSFFPRPPKVSSGGNGSRYDGCASSPPSSARAGGELTALDGQAGEEVRENQAKPMTQPFPASPRGT